MANLYIGPYAAWRKRPAFHDFEVRGCEKCQSQDHPEINFCGIHGTPLTIYRRRREVHPERERLIGERLYIPDSNSGPEIERWVPNALSIPGWRKLHDEHDAPGLVSIDGELIARELEAFEERFGPDIKTLAESYGEAPEIGWGALRRND